MNVLVVHNFYLQAGGEDEVFRAETRELGRLGPAGVRVSTYTARNAPVGGRDVGAALRTVWNPAAAREIGQLVRERSIDVVHFHNTFQTISPAAYRAARSAGAAVVQTLHNYRLLCPASTLFRDGRPCEDCVGRLPWPAVRHACYRDSRAASGVVAAMLGTHRALGTYSRHVDLYVALTEQARDVYVRGGLPADRLVVKPNFLTDDPEVGKGGGDYALYVGRLTPEKGITTLLEAWRTLGPELPLRIAGDGPLAPEVGAAAREQPGVTFLGQQPQSEVRRLMRSARLLVFPSQWAEPFGMTLIEAFASGLPVVAARVGSAAALVAHGVTGRHFRPGDAADLAAQVRWLLAHPADLAGMRAQARLAYEAHYAAPANVRALLALYEEARRRRAQPAQVALPGLRV
ncbi:glycosyltransferase [Deinococcus petrolearius]|uniref:Glycosyltransferase n=1 Tax=Deinococcus petrolearius TaxID=1751295 RepID=A0ABW1DLQ3_9DEIO